MGVLVLVRDAEYTHGLRPLDILRDLDGIGKLVNLAFADDITQDGPQVQRDLMMLSAVSPFVWALRRISSEMRDSFDGFVWIENDNVVGNATLTRDNPRQRVWTITNVAVHPDYRRRGIARSLMQACLDAVNERGGGCVVLQVKPDNKAAYDLYSSMGFRYVDGVVTARHGGRLSEFHALDSPARRVRPEDWRLIYDLVKAARSPLAERIAPLTEKDYQQTRLRRLADSLSDAWNNQQRFWLACQEGNRFLAAARVHLRSYGGCTVDVTIHPHGRNRTEAPLLRSALAACSLSGSAPTVNVPSGEQQAQTLLWQYGFTQTRHLHRLMLDIQEKNDGRDE